MKRCLLAVGLLAAWLVWAGTALAAVSYGEPFPKGTVGYASPPLGLRVVVTEGDRIEGATLTLDGRPLPVQRRGALLWADPPEPLASGHHEVSVSVRFNHPWAPLELAWRFQVAEGALRDYPPPAPEAADVLKAVNAIRGEADLPPLRLHPALGAAALAHARYYVQNPLPEASLAAHEEAPGRSGFTGREPWERGSYFGYPFSYYGEDMHFLPEPRQAVADWRDSVYHRLPLLEARAEHLGYAQGGRDGEWVNVLQVGSTGAGEGATGAGGDGAVIYPAPGQTGVPTTWSGNEIPNPYRPFPGARAAGYPITVQFPRPEVKAAVVVEAGLDTASGRAIPLWVLDSSNDAHIGPNVALLPRTDLEPGVRHHVRLAVRLRLRDGGERLYSRRFWFTTAGGSQPAEPAPARAAYLDGLPLPTDVPPVILRARAFLPARALFTALGMEVTWDGHTRAATASGGGRVIRLKVGNDLARVDGREVALDVPPFVWRGRLLVPVRFVVESLGLTVRWDAGTRSVHVERASAVSAEEPGQ